jgi:hypothetical protein
LPPWQGAAAAEKKPRENDVHLHLRQLTAHSLQKMFCFGFSCSAFLSVSRQGEFENTKKTECVSKKITEDIFFPGGFFLFFLSTFLLRWLSASR